MCKRPTVVFGDSLVIQDRTEQGMKSKVKDLMVTKVVTLDENASVKDAVAVMNEFEIGSLIVVSEKGKAAGIITERDILRRVVAEERNTRQTKVKEVMSSPLMTIEPNAEVEEAIELMFEMKIKKLAVVDKEKLSGIVSLTDIARVQPQIMKKLKQIANSQSTPKSIKKVIDYYVV